MTTLHILGSGSKGNAFAIEAEGGTLLLEAGFSGRELERRMRAQAIDPASVCAIAVTHEHGDHARGATRLARQLGVPVVASGGTWTALARGGEPCEWQPTGSRGPAVVGPFTIEACPCPHDAAEPLALGVRVADGPSLAIATDFGRPTQALRFFLRERHCLILEANYDEVLLRSSGYPAVVQDRIAGAGGHLSNTACGMLLAELHHAELHTVVLAHLSQRCNTPDVAARTVAAALERTGFRGALHVAPQDEPLGPITLRAPAQRVLL
ncbi:MAG: MBL fold metallo-hydrolase [Gemmatimonadetes bacterium]|nr:MBL fold metallo-hydrolase [Gemmatimonadota bacterium]MCB9504938.1 MBL fold metallo-hydrolase [Gemmatimonadales bacterium]HPF62544.1 MBL fold metallo-hydrolase [Gemmatimonadales bacterium]